MRVNKKNYNKNLHNELNLLLHFFLLYRNIPEDVHRIQTLQVLDLRLNQVDSELPNTAPSMPGFFSINLHGNRLRDFDMRRAKNLHVVNLSDNNLTTLNLHKGKLKMLNARNNSKSATYGKTYIIHSLA